MCVKKCESMAYHRIAMKMTHILNSMKLEDFRGKLFENIPINQKVVIPSGSFGEVVSLFI